MNRLILASSVAGLALVAMTPGASASGYLVREQGALTQGNSHAGGAARGDDPSALFFNPAASAWMDGTNISASLSGILPRAEAESGSASRTAAFGGTTITGSLGGDVAYDALVPSSYATHRLNDQVAFGLAFSAPFGLVTKYPGDSIGRYQALTSSLRTVNVTPSVSVRPLPNLSIGVGLQFQYASARLSNAVDFGAIGAAASPAFRALGFAPGNRDGRATVEGTDWDIGWQVGVQYEPIAGTRIGAAFRSAIFHNLRGEAQFEGVPAQFGLSPALTQQFQNTAASAKIATPESVTLGVSQRIGDRVTLLAGAEWTNWSRFRELRIDFDNGRAPSVTSERWRDSWFLNIGAEYQATRTVTLRTGFAWDQSPVRDGTRTPRIPDTDRYWLSAGATWQATPNLALTLAYTHVFADTARVSIRDRGPGTENFTRGNLDASYKASVDIVAVAARLSF
ncbi:OmpP1/FadL family transporter [Roseomonas sp. CCTCC AB2023176]|uniref:OmpP1/FadL family transporter n=1 Tax=Roseomonas sp. CCTCC AB2023176 TaxID=3342640 RepID=UPI0035E22F12